MNAILGSCRQRPIERLGKYALLQEDLTYPHYAKELLQAVRFLRNNDIDPSDTRLCFRTGILADTAVSWEALHEQLAEASTIVVEVASLKEYRYKDLYLHHVVADSDAYPACRELRGQITVREQTRSELETDIRELRELLSDKQVLVVGHICTYQRGKRYELLCWLRNACAAVGLSFLDPAVLQRSYSTGDLYANEATLMHYTAFGEAKVAELYREALGQLGTRTSFGDTRLVERRASVEPT